QECKYYHQSLQQRNGYVPYLLPLSGSVDGSSLIVLRIYARDRGKIDHYVVPGVLPQLEEYHYKRPVFRFTVPFHRSYTQGCQYAFIYKTVFDSKHRIGKVTDHYPGKEVRQKNYTLIYF